jgi:hypothetical protein
VKASYEGGRLEVLLPAGKSQSLIDRIDALGRAGHVSESVVRYQNNEMAKADVAFEVLSRYFARQIVDILDATDPGDREIREREMRGLEQFFGMGIAGVTMGGPGGVPPNPPGAAAPTPGMLGQVKQKLGFEEKPEAPALGSFPTTGAAVRHDGGPGKPAATAQGAAKSAPAGGGQPQGPARDWSKMIARVKADVERICDFLEALAKHPRGLQKYHEEAVRTVHDSWIDREGEQSLRRWVRSECARIWPHKFAAIDAEKERARADIEALEELFGAGVTIVTTGGTEAGVAAQGSVVAQPGAPRANGG